MPFRRWGQPAKWAAAFWGEEGTRKRATLSYRRTADTAIIGFLGRHTHFILTIDVCLILHPALKAMLYPLARLGIDSPAKALPGAFR